MQDKNFFRMDITNPKPDSPNRNYWLVSTNKNQPLDSTFKIFMRIKLQHVVGLLEPPNVFIRI